MAHVNVVVNIDEDLRDRGEKLFDELGLDLSNAISVFISMAIREGGIPFMLTKKIDSDPFYSESNMKVLRASIADMEAGRGIVRKTISELEAKENE